MKTKKILKDSDKIFYTIGEVSEIVGVQQHVLRNWEKEIGFLKPIKKSSGHRLYRRKDVQIALRIKELLYDEMYTIPGARKRLWYEMKRNELPATSVIIKKVKSELKELLLLLNQSKEKF